MGQLAPLAALYRRTILAGALVVVKKMKSKLEGVVRDEHAEADQDH
jgi:hypothetical protein